MKQYVVDAFTKEVFCGNPAAVCVLDEPISDELMQKITIENNLSETAFPVKEGDHYHLRWFTPGGEIDLCGHATLGSAFVILNYYEPEAGQVKFNTMSGELIVDRKGDVYEMDFPAYHLTKVDVTAAMEEAYGARPIEAYMDRDLVCVFDSEDVVRNMAPDQNKLAELDGLLQHATAKGSGGNDCVSRTFAPKMSVPEDPVCGSGHCHIVPYWAGKLEKDEITAYQASSRGGTLYCRLDGDRIKMAGSVTVFSEDELHI